MPDNARHTARLYRRMHDLAVTVLHERDPSALHGLVLAELLSACDAEIVVFKEGDWRMDAGPMTIATGGGAATALTDERACRQIRTGRPFSDYYATTPGTVPLTAQEIGRALDLRDVRRFAPGRRFAFGIPLPGTHSPVRGYVLLRPDGAFTASDCAYGTRIQPLLHAVDRQWELLSQWHAMRQAPSSSGEVTKEQDPSADAGLTPREAAVLLLLADALTAAAIGRRLGITTRTANKHIERIYRKLGTRDRVSTLNRARTGGLLPR
ncbi:LuxR C-terminal-related transcriptional regulator [Kitasatospora sp. NPDC058046]|uniref:helix-turn-helix transcriptional regulator n=1 Tax=Kitasatospora sp. NPDC058046 TaxID=3346312 RepID=UPI0036DBAEEC